MTSTFRNQYWTRIQLDLKSKEDGSTKTVYFIQQPPRFQWVENWFPILIDVSELGVTAGQYIPEQSSGSFDIDNTIGTFGFMRKFSDILDRYTATNQKITVAFAVSVIDDPTPALSFSTEWIGYVTNVRDSISASGAVLTFNVSSEPLVDRVITKQVSAIEFPTLPVESEGKSVPIAFGKQPEVVPIELGEINSDKIAYAYATEMPDVWEYAALDVGNLDGSECGLFVADEDGEYAPVYSPATLTYFSDNEFGSPSAQISLNANPERLCLAEFDLNAGVTFPTNWICEGGRVQMWGNGTGGRTSTAKLRISLWTISIDTASYNIPVKELTSIEIDLSDYDASNNVVNTKWWIDFYWPRAIVLNPRKYRVAIGFSASGWASGEAGLACNGSLGTFWTRSTAAADASGFKFVFDQIVGERVHLKLFQPGVIESTSTFTDTDSDGLRLRYFEIDHTGFPSPAPDLSTLQLLARPTRNASVEGVQDLMHRLCHEWDGSDWNDVSKFDASATASACTALFASSGTNSRSLIGATRGTTSLFQFMEDIARNSCSRVGQNNSGQWFLWPWGYPYTSEYRIPQEDISALSFDIAGPDSVINRVSVRYGYTYQTVRLQNAAGQASLDNFLYSLNWDLDTDVRTAHLIGLSQTLYGKRSANESQCEYIYDLQSAETFAAFLLILSRDPQLNGEIIVPYEKYRTIKMFDVLNLSHPAFPAYRGASPYTLPQTYKGSGSGNTDEALAKRGYTTWRAQTYRAIVESRFIKSSFDAPPLIRLGLRFITNPNDPT